MLTLKEKENILLKNACNEFDIPVKLLKDLLKSAKIYSYENKSSSVRKKDYLGLINFYIKEESGDK